MPPIGIPTVVVWALGAVGAAVIAKVVKSEWHRVNAELHPRQNPRATDNVDRARLPTLRRDPKTGVYRVE
jgi:hypothetical protein